MDTTPNDAPAGEGEPLPIVGDAGREACAPSGEPPESPTERGGPPGSPAPTSTAPLSAPELPTERRGSPGEEAWTCPSCGASVASPFCSGCGERRFHPDDLRFRHLLEQLLESLVHFDGRLFRTVRVLFGQPGRLTTDFLRGCRRPYVAPFHAFLVANLVFFFVQIFSGLSLFSGVRLSEHLDHEVYSGFAQRMVAHRLVTTDTTLSQYTPVFNRAESLYAKTLILVMLPLFAVGAGLVFFDRRRPAVAHLVYAIHYYAFLLLALSLVFPVLGGLLVGLSRLGLPINGKVLDWIALAIEGALCVVYLARSAASVYQTGPLRSWLSAIVLTLATLRILYGYRLVLFLVTFWTT